MSISRLLLAFAAASTVVCAAVAQTTTPLRGGGQATSLGWPTRSVPPPGSVAHSPWQAPSQIL